MTFLANPITGLLGQGAAALGAGLLDRKTSRPTDMQRQQRQLIDQILEGVQGQGPFAGAFGGGGEQAFERSVVQPSLQRFQDQIAPQIQQSFISRGQAGGSGLENALTQAGVNLNSLIDQQLLPFLQSQQQAQRQGLSSVLGFQEPQQTSGLGAGLNVFRGVGGLGNIENLLGSAGLGANSRRGFSS